MVTIPLLSSREAEQCKIHILEIKASKASDVRVAIKLISMAMLTDRSVGGRR